MTAVKKPMNDVPAAPVLVDSVPADPAPTPNPAPEATPPAADPAPAPAPEPELYELPDGRKVDAATLTKEWKDNFAPEFTRRSQELAALKGGNPPDKQTFNNPPDNTPEWQKEDYVPKSYAEVIQIAKAEAIAELARSAAEEDANAKAVTDAVEASVNALKAKDPNLDENALFSHAVKYGFRDLNQAYANMKAMGDVARETEERITKGRETRKADPIAATPGTVQPTSGVDRAAISQFRSATEFFRSLGGK